MKDEDTAACGTLLAVDDEQVLDRASAPEELVTAGRERLD